MTASHPGCALTESATQSAAVIIVSTGDDLEAFPDPFPAILFSTTSYDAHHLFLLSVYEPAPPIPAVMFSSSSCYAHHHPSCFVYICSIPLPHPLFRFAPSDGRRSALAFQMTHTSHTHPSRPRSVPHHTCIISPSHIAIADIIAPKRTLGVPSPASALLSLRRTPRTFYRSQLPRPRPRSQRRESTLTRYRITLAHGPPLVESCASAARVFRHLLAYSVRQT